MIEYSKYKRVFAFGCSFTCWTYPTWADIIAKCCEDAEYHNLASGGGGNHFISSRLTQANLHFNFCETDLVLLMFSTPFREDRWLSGEWKLYGNIYNQPFYNKEFIKKYVDPNGMIIRDLNITELTYTYLNSLPCDNLMLRSADPGDCEFLVDDEIYGHKLLALYNNSQISKLPPALMSFEDPIPRDFVYRDGTKGYDGHHLPIQYLRYLQSLNIPITENAIMYATEATDIVLNAQYEEELHVAFPRISNLDERGIF